MKDILAGILVFLLVGSLYIVVSEKRHDNFNEIPSGSVILDVDDNFLVGHLIQYKNIDEVEMLLIYPIALMKNDGTFYNIGDTINHYNVNGDIIYKRKP